MPPEEIEPRRIFIEFGNGECQEIQGVPEISLESENIPDDCCARRFDGQEMTFELTKESQQGISEFFRTYFESMDKVHPVLKRTILCNNWRRMHGLPLIRRRLLKSI